MADQPLPSPSRRAEIVARALYREWMGDDYDNFPWDELNTPSNETEEEARELAEAVVKDLDTYDPDAQVRDERRLAVTAVIKSAQELVLHAANQAALFDNELEAACDGIVDQMRTVLHDT